MKKILVLQHIAVEDPGFLKDLMEADGWKLIQIELDQGDRIPDDLSQFDAMLCMGGPMDTWMEQQYPWLIDEKKCIHEWVLEQQKPFIGFCLGCQLLGEILGGEVTPSKPPEIGVLDIALNQAMHQDPIFNAFPPNIKALQWHSYEVNGLEKNLDVTLLGSSASTRYQIFKFREHAYAIQFHIEVRADTVLQWGKIPEYKAALEDSLGVGALDRLDQSAGQHMPEMNRLSQLLYEQFKKLLN